MKTIRTKNGLTIDALFIKEYLSGYLFFAQDRLVLTDREFKEIKNMDIIDFVHDSFEPVMRGNALAGIVG